MKNKYPDLPKIPGKTRQALQKALLEWFAHDHRKLPWRSSRNSYRVWVSEMMLQQTQVNTVIPYFRAFMRRFPSVRALAEAPLEDVLSLWSGLGYYRRARHLHEAAKIVCKKHSGQLPRSFDELLALPGIGRYSAGAILSIAYGLDFPVVDGNVIRVLSRIFALRSRVDSNVGKERLWNLAQSLLPPGQAGDFNQALMELGAMICTPRAPLCGQCPVQSQCRGYRERCPENYPRKKPGQRSESRRLACVAMMRRGKILLIQDAQSPWYRDLWRLPFFELPEGEIQTFRLEKRIRDDLGLEVRITEEIHRHRFTITHHRIDQTCFIATVQRGKCLRKKSLHTRWVSLESLKQFALPASQKEVVEKIIEKREKTGATGV